MDLTELMKITKLLKQQILPDNIMDLNIKFNHINEIDQQLNNNQSYNAYNLVNLNIIGSSSWLNISDKIGNNKFYIDNSEDELINDIDYKQSFLNRDRSNSIIIKSSDYSTIDNLVFPSNNRIFQNGDMNLGVYSPSENSYTIYPYIVFPKSNFSVNITNFLGYEFKISIFDYDSTTEVPVYNTTLSDNIFYNVDKTYNIGLPQYEADNNVSYKGYIITIRKTDLTNFPISIVQNNALFNIKNLAPVNNTIIAEKSVQVVGLYSTSNTKTVSIKYNYTFDYLFTLKFYNPTDNIFINSFTLTPNLIENTQAIQVLNDNLEGTKMFVSIQAITQRTLNFGDLANIKSVLNDIIIGNDFDNFVIIPDGFYSGIYNSVQNTNPIIAGFETIISLLTTKISGLDIVINQDLTITLENTSSSNINLSFSGVDGASSNRFLGFYNTDKITIPKNSFIKSPNPIDLDSNGRFDKIFVNIAQLGSSGFNGESNNVIFLQKGEFYLQNISTNNPFFKKSLGRNLNNIKLRLVDGENKLIEINDTILFTAQIECYNI